MSNATPRPWRMFLPLGIVLLLALLWTVYWFLASSVARERFAEERLSLAQQGLKLACTGEKWGGYPFHFEFTCSSPVLSYGQKAEIRSANLLLVALAYAPWQIAALLDGPTTLSAQGITPSEIKHQRALGAVNFDREEEASFSFELPAVSVTGLGTAEKLTLFTRPSASGGSDIAVQVQKVTYAPPGKPPLAVDDGSLLSTLGPDQILKVDKLELKQGAIRYWGSGTLALDQQHRIAGQIDTETNDVRALLQVVGPLLNLSDSKLSNLRTMLSLLGNSAQASIIAKEGVLYLGPFQIARLQPLY